MIRQGDFMAHGGKANLKEDAANRLTRSQRNQINLRSLNPLAVNAIRAPMALGGPSHRFDPAAHEVHSWLGRIL
jgi:hypothetical protein